MIASGVVLELCQDAKSDPFCLSLPLGCLLMVITWELSYSEKSLVCGVLSTCKLPKAHEQSA